MHCSATIKKINANIPQTFDFSLLIFLMFLLISPCKLLHSCTALSLASFLAFIKALTLNRLFLVCGMQLKTSAGESIVTCTVQGLQAVMRGLIESPMWIILCRLFFQKGQNTQRLTSPAIFEPTSI